MAALSRTPFKNNVLPHFIACHNGSRMRTLQKFVILKSTTAWIHMPLSSSSILQNHVTRPLTTASSQCKYFLCNQIMVPPTPAANIKLTQNIFTLVAYNHIFVYYKIFSKKRIKIWQSVSRPVPQLVCRAGICDKLDYTGRQVETARLPGVCSVALKTHVARKQYCIKLDFPMYQRSAPSASEQFPDEQLLEPEIECFAFGYASKWGLHNSMTDALPSRQPEPRPGPDTFKTGRKCKELRKHKSWRPNTHQA